MMSNIVYMAPMSSMFDIGAPPRRYLPAMFRKLCVIAAIAACAAPRPAERPRVAPDALPSLARWRQHVTDEVLPFWSTPDALGTPPGNFPTWRCNDGRVFDKAAPCRELAEGPAWLTKELGRDYTRMKSRQTYLYGVAYHLTGEERYLDAARAGVTWLRTYAYRPDGAISFWEHGEPGPAREQRTAQDLAYAQVGLAFYYYLTRDPAVLADLARLEHYIMTAYWNGEQLRWTLADGDTPGESRRLELVSQLDQINAYMLLVAPLIADDALAKTWRDDLLKLGHVIQQRYFAPEHGMFWGAIHDPALEKLGSDHTDFGHSMKSLWMLYLLGQQLEPALAEFARPHVAPLLARAAQPSGCWSSGLRADGSVERGGQWWIFAELDQAAATLAGREPDPETYTKYLAKSYACWFERWVDHKDHDVWPFLSADFDPAKLAADPPPKLFHWKNGYHVMEHAMVSMITTAGLTGQALPLYYAFVAEPPRDRIQPYYFHGVIAEDKSHPLPHHPSLHGRRVVFHDIR